ncbi:hypothetical protein D3C71_1329350 [compost metagenome]
MGDFQALAFTSEQHSVITNHITTTNRGKTDGFTLTRTGMAFTPVNRDFRQVTIQRAGNHLTHTQGSA